MAERRCHQQYTGSVSRRQVLGLLVGGAACACCGSVHAQKLAYDLSATEIASGTWAVHGSTEYFTLENGGNILNVALSLSSIPGHPSATAKHCRDMDCKTQRVIR